MFAVLPTFLSLLQRGHDGETRRGFGCGALVSSPPRKLRLLFFLAQHRGKKPEKTQEYTYVFKPFRTVRMYLQLVSHILRYYTLCASDGSERQPPVVLTELYTNV